MYFYMFHRRFINFSLRRLREKLQNVPRFEMDFVLNFAMCSADFTCVNDPDPNCFKGLTFWTLNKTFQETAYLSIILSLFIHKISSKRDRDYNIGIQAEFKLLKMLPTFITRITF